MDIQAVKKPFNNFARKLPPTNFKFKKINPQVDIVKFNATELDEVLRIANSKEVQKYLCSIDISDFELPNEVFVAKKQGKIIGWITYHIDEDKMKYLTIAIDSEIGEKHTSDLLLQECIKLAINFNLTEISTTIRLDNLFSQGLFRRNGFQLIEGLTAHTAEYIFE